MKKRRYTMRAKVWLYPGDTPWHFMTLPKKDSEAIKKAFGSLARGFGSLPVMATISKTSWKTSIFPDKMSGSYILPLKAKIRTSENIARDDTITFQIEIQA
ncbi:DUF1905 domain-containing protein [bacterium]|nr:DUF1905 domain-containing protein [bacterium]